MAGGNKGGKGRKLGRMEKICKAYTAGGMQEKNKKRRMRRHILRNPDDKTALSLFEQLWGNATSIIVTVNGKPTGKTMTGKGAKRRARRNDKRLQEKLREQRSIRRHAPRVAPEKGKEPQAVPASQ